MPTKINIVPDGTGNGEYVIMSGELDRVSAQQSFYDGHIARRVLIEGQLLKKEGIDANSQNVKTLLMQRAIESWPTELARIKKEPVPAYLLELLDAPTKKEQERILKGATITPEQLAAFVLEAEQRGFTYSRFSEHQNPKSTDPSKLPILFTKEEDGSIKSIGDTPLSEGQLKQLLNQRKVISVTILDKGDDWHCFFATYRGLAGQENYKMDEGGQPHLHYISSKWGSVTRQDVIDGARSGRYVSSSVHIDLLAYDAKDRGKKAISEPLPPQPITGTGLPESWLGVSGSLYTHHYPANKNVTSCGRHNTVPQVRVAWLRREYVGKQPCPSCQRQLEATHNQILPV